MTTYAGLILDFGGVVTTDFYAALAAFSVRSGLDAGAFVGALREDPEGRAAFRAAESGLIPQRDFEVVMGRLLGLPDNGLLANALADLEPRPAIIDLVKRSRAAGVKTAVLSNSWGTGDVDPYAGWGLDELFDTVVISDRVGLRKPDPEIFKLTASKIGLPAGQCLFVDDTKGNLRGARALGMGTVYFTGAAGEVDEIERLIGLSPA